MCYTLTPSFSVDLPSELWLEIIELISNRSALCRLMQVNRKLCALTEGVLYGNVSLHWGAEVTQFQLSMRSCPRRAGLVASHRV
ncbi:hypothetical protein BD309DRAFT_973039 [Dichomitus squalens]|nr:hypothetical protein BD309DRAFT_973039 [Dichomitus squalens]